MNKFNIECCNNFSIQLHGEKYESYKGEILAPIEPNSILIIIDGIIELFDDQNPDSIRENDETISYFTSGSIALVDYFLLEKPTVQLRIISKTKSMMIKLSDQFFRNLDKQERAKIDGFLWKECAHMQFKYLLNHPCYKLGKYSRLSLDDIVNLGEIYRVRSDSEL